MPSDAKLGAFRTACLGMAVAVGMALFGSDALADGLSAVPQLNGGHTSVFVPQLGSAPKRVVRSAPRRVSSAPAQRAQQVSPERTANSSIVDFAESTEALGFRLPSVRQGVRIIAQ